MKYEIDMKEKYFKYIGFSVWLLIMALITSFIVFSFNRIQKNEEANRKEQEAKAEIEKRKRHKEEYEALRLIGKDKWATFEDYLIYIKDSHNRRVLQAGLLEEGWDELSYLQSAYSLLDEFSICNYTTVVWNEIHIKELYLMMRKEGVDIGTLKEFKDGLRKKENFMWYYDKAAECGLVDDFETFLMLLFEPEEEE